MSSDASQSILRLTLLACATATFMVVWSGDTSRTVGLTLAERNREIVPAHAIGRTAPRVQLAQRPVRVAPAAAAKPARPAAAERSAADVHTLPGGTYRVVFADGRAEWLTVIDRAGAPAAAPGVMSTVINGQPAHVIRVTARATDDSRLR